MTGKALVIMGADFSSVALDTISINYEGGGSGGTETVYYTVTLSSSDTAYGTVSGGGRYAAGSMVTITAIPSSGHKFVSWSDGNTSPSRSVFVSGNISLVATFAVNEGGEVDPEPEKTMTWHVQTLSLLGSATAIDDAQLAAAPFALQANDTLLKGKKVNRIKLRIKTTGTMTIGVMSGLDNATIQQARTINVVGNKGDEVEFEFDTIDVNGYLVMCQPTDTALMYFAKTISNGGNGTFYYNVGSSKHSTGSNSSALCIDLGYYG